MPSALREQYRQLIIDHSQNPRHHHELDGESLRVFEMKNPLCNDSAKISLRLINDQISEIGALSCGCAISTASTSIMAERLKNTTVEDARRLYHAMYNMLVNDQTPDGVLGDLAVMAEVKKFPMRIKCAMLPWRAMHAALKNA